MYRKKIVSRTKKILSALFPILLGGIFIFTHGTLAKTPTLAPDNIRFPPDTPSVILNWPASKPFSYTLRVIDQTDSSARDSRSNCYEPGVYLCLTGLGVTAISMSVTRNHAYTWKITAGSGNPERIAHFAIARPILDTELIEKETTIPALATILNAKNKGLTSAIYVVVIISAMGAALILNRWVTSKLPKQEPLRIQKVATHDLTRERL